MTSREGISEDSLSTVFRQFLGFFPNTDESHLPGAWGPIIRKALQSTAAAFSAVHAPRLGAGPLPDPWTTIALNPQPLPPRVAFVCAVVREVADRALLIFDVANAQRGGGDQGIIIVSGYVSRFVDDYCGDDFRFKWPFPGPRPEWLSERVTSVDLVMAGLNFEHESALAPTDDLQEIFEQAGSILKRAGADRMR
ncbi:hypothetical protein Msil_0695 [Methylocella silvestris BL2]|uniref:Uncharacterized protein n=1 Tax=Methylocella silvestris (strain DSM 15510 / CIP 108128 / LMG 27833 / NCIMB 13906 / BL2) TaxID=395965 RepID=B8EP78_METSB|nr:hypothetical protein [Methylocella silvestris]ACK49666.1 hypothetical protein Msil_0695 [Methylocella silvestris BL2]